MIKVRPSIILITLLSVIAGSTVFFRYVESWSWVDSYFFTVITISTVGYGTIVPVTTLGKLATTALIFFGLGVFAVAIQQFALYHMRKREEHAEWLFDRLKHQARKPANPSVANNDDAPKS